MLLGSEPATKIYLVVRIKTMPNIKLPPYPIIVTFRDVQLHKSQKGNPTISIFNVLVSTIMQRLIKAKEKPEAIQVFQYLYIILNVVVHS